MPLNDETHGLRANNSNLRTLCPRTMNDGKTLTIELALNARFSTDGTTNPISVVTTSPLEFVGTKVEDIVVRTHGKEFTANYNYTVVGEYTNDGDTWYPFSSALFPVQTQTGSKNGAPHTNRADYGLHLRFKLQVMNGQGAAVESGTLTAYVTLKFWS